MASIRPKGTGWEAAVDIKRPDGSRYRKAMTFDRKAMAQAWAAEEETRAKAERRGEITDRPLSELITRYRDEVAANKKGGRFECLRLDAFLRDKKLANLSNLRVSPVDIAEWRDRRLKTVSAATVNREWNILSGVFTTARKEWRWVSTNPMSDVKRPAQPEARSRRPTQAEIDALCVALGYDRDQIPETETARVAVTFLFAIETAMRAGEICALEHVDIDVARRIARVRGEEIGAGKSGRRDVPLSHEALRLLAQLPDNGDKVFGITRASLDVLFRKGRARAGIVGLNFHDSRAEALTRLSTRLSPLQLAKVSGHKDLKMVLNVYYRETAEDIAKLI